MIIPHMHGRKLCIVCVAHDKQNRKKWFTWSLKKKKKKKYFELILVKRRWQAAAVSESVPRELNAWRSVEEVSACVEAEWSCQFCYSLNLPLNYCNWGINQDINVVAGGGGAKCFNSCVVLCKAPHIYKIDHINCHFLSRNTKHLTSPVWGFAAFLGFIC